MINVSVWIKAIEDNSQTGATTDSVWGINIESTISS